LNINYLIEVLVLTIILLFANKLCRFAFKRMKDAGMMSEVKFFFVRKLKFFQKSEHSFSAIAERNEEVLILGFKSLKTKESDILGMGVCRLEESLEKSLKMNENKNSEFKPSRRAVLDACSMVGGNETLLTALQYRSKDSDSHGLEPVLEEFSGEYFNPAEHQSPSVGQYMY